MKCMHADHPYMTACIHIILIKQAMHTERDIIMREYTSDAGGSKIFWKEIKVLLQACCNLLLVIMI